MRQLPPICLLLLPAFAGLEITSSELVSRRPDSLGEVVQADLDGDGDNDLLITGRRNDFAGWIEGSSMAHGKNLRPIDTGEIPMAGQRPALVAMGGSSLRDIHFPGWRLPNLYRKYGPPEPYPATAGLEFLAFTKEQIIARNPVTGEFSIISESGAVPLVVTNFSGSGVLRTNTAPKPGHVVFGDLNRDGRRDLIVVTGDGMIGETPVSPGIIGFRATATGFRGPHRLEDSIPTVFGPVWAADKPERLTGLMYGTNVRPNTEYPEDPNSTWIHAIFNVFEDFSEANNWMLQWVPRRVTDLATPRTDALSHATFYLRSVAPDTPATSIIERYRLDGHIRPVAISLEALPTPGTGELIPQKDPGELLVVFRGSDAEEGEETLRLSSPWEGPIDAELWVPFDGRLVAGPFGRLDSAEWIDPDQNGAARLLAATDKQETSLLFDSARPQNPTIISGLQDWPASSRPWWRSIGAPFAMDVDHDGDLDIIRPYSNGYFDGAVNVWENHGEGDFSLRGITSQSIWYSYYLGGTSLRHEYDPVSKTERMLFQKPGEISRQTIFTDDAYDPWWFPQPVALPGHDAKVILSDRDIDGDGTPDFVFFPSAFGNVPAFGKWNPEEGHLDTLEPLGNPLPAGVTIPRLETGDLEGDGTTEIYWPVPAADGEQVNWISYRHHGGILQPHSHPGLTFTEPVSRVLPLDLDDDGDTDLLRMTPKAGAAQATDGVSVHEVRWSEYIGGLWVNHDTVLGTLRTSASGLEPVMHADTTAGSKRLLLANRIGEILEIKTRAIASSAPINNLLSARGLRGASSDAEDDPDGDGIPNFAEMLAGTSPVVADAGFSVPVQASRSAESSGWIVTLPLALEDYGIGALIETTTDMKRWTRQDSPPLPLGAGPSGHRYLFTDAGVASSSTRFARIVFDQQ